LRWCAAFLIAVIAGIMVVGSVVSRFARAELLNTDHYVATVAPLATDPVVQAAVTQRVTDEVMVRLPIAELTTKLADSLGLRNPQSVSELTAPTVTAWLTGQVRAVVNEVVTSESFPVVWQQVNRSAHQAVRSLLTGEAGRYASTDGTSVVVNLGPVLDAAKQALVAHGFSMASRIPQVSIPYKVADIQELPKIQKYVRLLNTTATWLPLVAVALLGLAAWIAPNRRRGLFMGLLISAFLLTAVLIANQVWRGGLPNRATLKGFNGAVALNVYDTVIRFLITALATVLVACLLGMVWLWLAGPSRPAMAFRRGVNRVLGWVAGRFGPGDGVVKAGRFARRWHVWIGVIVAVPVCWWLLSRPSVGTVVLAFLLAGVATAVLAVAQRLGAPEKSSF
jgi:hypothetical protein